MFIYLLFIYIYLFIYLFIDLFIYLFYFIILHASFMLCLLLLWNLSLNSIRMNQLLLLIVCATHVHWGHNTIYEFIAESLLKL